MKKPYLIGLFIICILTFIYFLVSSKNRKLENQKINITPVISPTSKQGENNKYRESFDRMKKTYQDKGLHVTAVSPDGSTFAYFTYYESEINNNQVNIQKNSLFMNISAPWNFSEDAYVVNCVLPHMTFPDSIWKLVLAPESMYISYLRNLQPPSENYTMKGENVLAWSQDGLTLAFLAPENLYIYQFQLEKNPAIPAGYGNCKLGLILKNTINIPFHWLKDYSPIQLYFSGDDSELYIQTDTFYRYSLASQKLENVVLSEQDGRSFSPIPNGKGIVYATRKTSDEGVTDGIILDTWTGKKYFAISKHNDGISNILLSPNQQYVCLEEQASGSHWYSIYKLPSVTRIASSGQYSYCDIWLNNEQILVKENPYFGSEVTNSILLNVSNGSRRVISTKSDWSYLIFNELQNFDYINP